MSTPQDGESSPPDADEAFPGRLRAARDLRSLSAAELGRACAIPATSISHFESGSRKPSFSNLAKLAAALKVSTDSLLGRSDDPGVAQGSDVLFRQVQKLSHEDIALTERFIQMLAERGKAAGGETRQATGRDRRVRRRHPPKARS